MEHPHKLSAGINNTVIALNRQEAAKLFVPGQRADMHAEATKMQFANAVNNLVVQFVRFDHHVQLRAEMLVMERIYPLDFRAYEVETRLLWLEVFEDELRQLHHAGFVHRDLQRPTHIDGMAFDNILLTHEGLRLVDLGISALREQVGEALFLKYLEMERAEMAAFRRYFLNR
jgi:serine/threonine protein kinase